MNCDAADDLYPDLAAKAAALMHSLVLNHPFVDRKKRTGSAAAELFLRVNGTRLDAGDQELEAVTLATASGDVQPVESHVPGFNPPPFRR